MQRRPLLMAAGLAAFLPSTRAMAEAGEIVLGNTGILTGPLGGPVRTMLAGAGLAFAEANAAGGVVGRKIRVVSLDDELKPDKAIANYEKLLTEHKAFAFFGCVGSGTTAAAAKVLKESGAAMVGGFAVADSAREKTRGSAYYVRATSGREAEALVQHLTTIGISRIAVAHLDNPGGVEALTLIDAALAKFQLKPLASAGVKGDASNAAAVAKTLAAAAPQAVIMYLGGPLGGEVMKALWALDSHPSFYGMSIVPGELIAKVVGERARGLAISQIVPYPWNEVDAQVKEYRRLATAAKVPVGYYSFEGYVNALVMVDALKRTGSDHSRVRLHTALRATKLRIAGMDVDFTTGQHTGSRFVELVQVTHEGRFVR
ncbi:MAG: ABC transporter substrate-binding protein [Cytophagales bacterium]|nr:ABC transporter substrate-binding protein [Rhizobacter sp.]